MKKFARFLTPSIIITLTLTLLLTPSPVVTQTAAQEQSAAKDSAAQDEARAAGPLLEMSSAVERPLGVAPILRTAKQVGAAEVINRLKKVPPRHGRPRLRPTMDQATYESLKTIANMNVPALKVGDTGRGAADELTGRLAPPVTIGVNINGDSEAGLNPPDTHGAVGPNHYVQVTNSRITRFSKTGTLLSSVSLASFFGYTLTTVFDPRVIYDRIGGRWIVMAEAFQESATVQRCFIAVSTTNSAVGSYFVYGFDINLLNNDDFFDYPQLGVDLNDIIVTANIFGPTTYRGSRVYAFPKATMYAGSPASFTQFAGASLNFGTIAPPVVLDNSANAYLISAPNGGNALRVYRLSDAAPRLTFTGTVPVPAYSVPPDAPQPSACSTQRLDTVDSRFVNASTQIGASLFNVHTISVAGFATPRYYEINPAVRSLLRSSTFFASRTSHDFNASIAANTAKDMVVTWSSVDPSNNVNAQVRFGGRRATDPTTAIGVGTLLFQSPTCAKEGTASVLRWGDYSAVSVDPLNSLFFWVVNEKMNTQLQWGSRIGRVNF
jgi:hypothetical protein